MIPLQFKGFRFHMKFLMADVSRPILGLDFLETYDAIINVKENRISESFAGASAASSCPQTTL